MIGHRARTLRRTPRSRCICLRSLVVVVLLALLGTDPPQVTHTTASSPADPVRSAVRTVDTLAGEAHFGVAVLDRSTMELVVGEGGATAIPAASVIKLYTVVAILHRAEVQHQPVPPDLRSLIRLALTRSDDHAMNALWVRSGGAQSVAEAIVLIGLRDTRPPIRRSQWGESMTSARDVVAVYEYILTSMTPEMRDLIMSALRAAEPILRRR